jgi:hypothetical protein
MLSIAETDVRLTSCTAGSDVSRRISTAILAQLCDQVTLMPNVGLSDDSFKA